MSLYERSQALWGEGRRAAAPPALPASAEQLDAKIRWSKAGRVLGIDPGLREYEQRIKEAYSAHSGPGPGPARFLSFRSLRSPLRRHTLGPVPRANEKTGAKGWGGRLETRGPHRHSSWFEAEADHGTGARRGSIDNAGVGGCAGAVPSGRLWRAMFIFAPLRRGWVGSDSTATQARWPATVEEVKERPYIGERREYDEDYERLFGSGSAEGCKLAYIAERRKRNKLLVMIEPDPEVESQHAPRPDLGGLRAETILRTRISRPPERRSTYAPSSTSVNVDLGYVDQDILVTPTYALEEWVRDLAERELPLTRWLAARCAAKFIQAEGLTPSTIQTAADLGVRLEWARVVPTTGTGTEQPQVDVAIAADYDLADSGIAMVMAALGESVLSPRQPPAPTVIRAVLGSVGPVSPLQLPSTSTSTSTGPQAGPASYPTPVLPRTSMCSPLVDAGPDIGHRARPTTARGLTTRRTGYVDDMAADAMRASSATISGGSTEITQAAEAAGRPESVQASQGGHVDADANAVADTDADSDATSSSDHSDFEDGPASSVDSVGSGSDSSEAHQLADEAIPQNPRPHFVITGAAPLSPNARSPPKPRLAIIPLPPVLDELTPSTSAPAPPLALSPSLSHPSVRRLSGREALTPLVPNSPSSSPHSFSPQPSPSSNPTPTHSPSASCISLVSYHPSRPASIRLPLLPSPTPPSLISSPKALVPPLYSPDLTQPPGAVPATDSSTLSRNVSSGSIGLGRRSSRRSTIGECRMRRRSAGLSGLGLGLISRRNEDEEGEGESSSEEGFRRHIDTPGTFGLGEAERLAPSGSNPYFARLST